MPYMQCEAARLAGALQRDGQWFAPLGADLAPFAHWLTRAIPPPAVQKSTTAMTDESPRKRKAAEAHASELLALRQEMTAENDGLRVRLGLAMAERGATPPIASVSISPAVITHPVSLSVADEQPPSSVNGRLLAFSAPLVQSGVRQHGLTEGLVGISSPPDTSTVSLAKYNRVPSPIIPDVPPTLYGDDTHGVLSKPLVGVGQDNVGGFLLGCFQYTIITVLVMVLMTVTLNLHSAVMRSFAPLDITLGTESRHTCTDSRLYCVTVQLYYTLVSAGQALAGALDVARETPNLSVVATCVILAFYQTASRYGWIDKILLHAWAVVSRIHCLVQSGTKCAAIICLVYFLMAKANGATDSDVQVYNQVVREHARNDWVMFHVDVASRVSEMWSHTMVMPAVHSLDELVLIAEADGLDAANAKVIDTGARRSVIRDRASFDPLTCRPAPFRIRGVLGASGQPDFMGNAIAYLPVSDTALGEPCKMEAVVLVDAVCIPACPHDIIAVGPLLSGGARLWLAAGQEQSWLQLHSGSFARLYNRAIIFANAYVRLRVL